MDCANATYCDRVRPGGVAAAPACLVVAAAGNDTAANATCDLSVSGGWVAVGGCACWWVDGATVG